MIQILAEPCRDLDKKTARDEHTHRTPRQTGIRCQWRQRKSARNHIEDQCRRDRDRIDELIVIDE